MTPAPLKRKRVRSGCLVCRRKKRKCDETKPTCLRCSRVNDTCIWASKVTFGPVQTSGHIETDVSSPVAQDADSRQPTSFHFFDETNSIVRQFNEGMLVDEDSPGGDDAGAELHSILKGSDRQFVQVSTPSDSNSLASCERPANPADDSSVSIKFHQSPAALTVGSSHDSFPTPSIWDQGTPSLQATDAAENLLFLRQTGPGAISPAQSAPSADVVRLAADSFGMPITSDGESPFLDEIFAPNSAYFELSSTLRHFLIQEARSTCPTREGTPLPVTEGSESADQEELFMRHKNKPAEEASANLTSDEEYKLYRVWINELSHWLDKFDPRKHCRSTLPTLAKSHPHLHYAILAISARQIELIEDPNGSVDRSLALYQQAIHLLLPHLATRSTAVIASCVVLCVLEMASCSPKAWKRHLDGCATLLQAVDIHGFSGGVEQALFWVFARMDLWLGLISSTKMLIPITRWTPASDLASAVYLFRSDPSYENYANYSVFLTAHAIDLLSTKRTGPTAAAFQSHIDDEEFVARWHELYKFLSEWYTTRPNEMQPVLSRNSDPFPTLLFSNSAAISGNQIYHTSMVLMLQYRPPQLSLTPKPRSILWHARQVVGISISNEHHGCWTNAIQPLWVAGMHFSSPTEHKVILDMLATIERETGWATRWRADDLRAWWGDLEV